jgi:hypothetical protein
MGDRRESRLAVVEDFRSPRQEDLLSLLPGSGGDERLDNLGSRHPGERKTLIETDIGNDVEVADVAEVLG